MSGGIASIKNHLLLVSTIYYDLTLLERRGMTLNLLKQKSKPRKKRGPRRRFDLGEPLVITRSLVPPNPFKLKETNEEEKKESNPFKDPPPNNLFNNLANQKSFESNASNKADSEMPYVGDDKIPKQKRNRTPVRTNP